MAISRGNLKKPQVVEEESDSEFGSDSEMEPEDGEMELGYDVKNIKQEEEEEDDDDENDTDENDTAKEIKKEIPDDNDAEDNYETDDSSSIEIKEEDESDIDSEEIDDDNFDGKPEADQAADSGSAKSAVTSVRVVEDNSDGSEVDSVDDYGTDESEKEIESDEDNNKERGSTGLANVMAKILATKKSNNIILSKAKKTNKVQEKAEDSSDDNFEIVDDTGKVKKEPDIKQEKEESEVAESLHKRELQKKIWENRFRVKPNITDDREKERRLRVLATQGVVQLFSAIEKHKNMVQRKLSETRSITGREKVLETTGKAAFLEVLRQQGNKVKTPTEEEPCKEEIKDEQVDIPPPPKKPRWNVLADNFYKEPTLQGWDQQSDDD